jgi:hypothetical protein
MHKLESNTFLLEVSTHVFLNLEHESIFIAFLLDVSTHMFLNLEHESIFIATKGFTQTTYMAMKYS